MSGKGASIGTEPAKTRKGERTRQRILEIAAEEFAQNGYQVMSVKKICERMNIAVGTFYHYFSSKQELIYAKIDDIGRLMSDYYLRLDKQSYGDAILKFVEYYIEQYDKIGSELMATVKSHFLFEKSNEYGLDHFAISRVLWDAFENGHNKGEFLKSHSVKFMVDVAFGLFDINTTRWCQHDDIELFKSSVLQEIETFLKLVTVDPADRKST